jgi:hypothetical protein
VVAPPTRFAAENTTSHLKNPTGRHTARSPSRRRSGGRRVALGRAPDRTKSRRRHARPGRTEQPPRSAPPGRPAFGPSAQRVRLARARSNAGGTGGRLCLPIPAAVPPLAAMRDSPRVAGRWRDAQAGPAQPCSRLRQLAWADSLEHRFASRVPGVEKAPEVPLPAPLRKPIRAPS